LCKARWWWLGPPGKINSMWSCKVATKVSVHEPRSLSFFSCTLQTRWKFVVNSCDVLTVTAEIGSHDIAFQPLETDLATRVLNHQLHLGKTLLPKYRMLMCPDCCRRKLNEGQRKGVLLFIHRYAASGVSALSPPDFTSSQCCVCA
jgi:hypothetical protein